MAAVTQLVREAMERKRTDLADANQRLADARARLDEAQATARTVAADLSELTDWLARNPI